MRLSRSAGTVPRSSLSMDPIGPGATTYYTTVVAASMETASYSCTGTSLGHATESGAVG